MTQRNVNALKQEIAHRVFDIAKQLFGLTDGNNPHDPEHHQPSPIPGSASDTDGFWFSPQTKIFHDRQTGFKGDIFALVEKIHNVGFKEAFDIVANAAGFVTPTEWKVTYQFETSELKEDSPIFKKVQSHRPDITFETYRRVGAVLYRCGNDSGVAIPMFANDGQQTGWVRYGVDGSKKNSKGSKSGIVGTQARDALLGKQAAKIIFKTAGVSDYLILLQRIREAGLESDFYAFTTAAGEGESPAKFDPLLRLALQGKTVAVIQDNDEAGIAGANRWAGHLAKYAADVRIVSLPQTVFDCPVKDVRDFLSLNGTSVDDLVTLFDTAERVTKTKSKKQAVASTGKVKAKLAPTGVPLLDKFCRKLKRHKFNSMGDMPNHMEYAVQSINEVIRIAKARKLDLAQKNGEFYVYNGQFWEKVLTTSFNSFLRNATLQFGIQTDLAQWHKFQEKVRDQFKDFANFPFVQNDNTIHINLKSGTLEFREGQKPQLVKFNKLHGLTYQLGYDYDPAATSPVYTQFLDRCVPDAELQLLLEEYAGYIFQNRFNFEMILFLYGSGANGKSVWLAALTALLGKQNVIEYGLSSITKKQEYRVKLADGLLNISTESGADIDPDMLKKIASREPLECRRLYENPITITNYARQICATNVLPKTTEATEGFFRRFLLVPFNVFIPPEERNYRMNTVEFWEESGELPGILNFVIKGLQRLLHNGSFTASDQADKILDEYKRDSDSVVSFMQDEGYQPDSVVKMPLKELYREYKDYCIERKHHAVSDKTMSKRLQNNGYVVVKGTGGIKFVYTIKIISF